MNDAYDVQGAARTYARAQRLLNEASALRTIEVVKAHESGASYAQIARLMSESGCNITRARVQQIVNQNRIAPSGNQEH